MVKDFLKQIKRIEFSIGSPELIQNISSACITIPELYDNGFPKFNGLFDLRMGTQDTMFICKTCKHNMKNCTGHMGHIKLSNKVYYIHFINTVKKILQCVCNNCSKLLIDKSNTNVINKILKKNKKERMKIIQKLCNNNTKKICNGLNGCGKFQPKYIKEGTSIFMVFNLLNEDGSSQKKNEKIKLLADDCYEILKKISDEDSRLLGLDPKSCRPEWLICSYMNIPPPSIRPSVKHDTNLRSEDDLTYKLLDIVKANNMLKNKNFGKDKYIKDYIDYLQYNVTTLFDNEIKGIPPAQQRTGRLLKSLRQRLKGKDGRIRGNIMGKRVNFSARSVVSPDAFLKLDELGVPILIAKNMTIPVKVNKYNKNELLKYIKNGPNIHPGANFIIKNNEDRLDLRYCNLKNLEINEGDTVERHIIDGDYVLFNRQPSLHKMSMMAHKAVIMDYLTFRLNVSVTTPYNADFDGDEMNLYLPQSNLTKIELEELASVPKQIISARSNKPIISTVMDTLLGSYLLTKDNIKIDKKTVFQILASIDFFENDKNKDFKLNKNFYNGKDIFSLILPNINYKRSNNDFTINYGKLQKGNCSKLIMGNSSGSLIHVISNDIGLDVTKKFINDIQNVTRIFILKNGFSVGIGDCIPDEKTSEHIDNIIAKAKADVKNLITANLNSDFNLDIIKSIEEDLENRIKNILNSARDNSGDYASKKITHGNSLMEMINAGSKGNFINISQIMASVGQQNVTSGTKNGRINFGFKNRTLPHFTKYDNSPESRGFVENSFIKGLKPQEFFFHAMSGREGLIDTAVKTSETGYIQRRLMKAMEDLKVHYDLSVRNEANDIIQFIYGGDCFDGSKVEKQRLEILSHNDKEFIKKFKWTKKEIRNYLENKNSDIQNTTEILKIEYKKILNYRKFLQDNSNEDTSIYAPINIYRILKQRNIYFKCNLKKSNLNPIYVYNEIEKLCNSFKILLFKSPIADEINKICLKKMKMLIRTKLSTKVVIIENKLTKEVFDWIIEKIKLLFEKCLIQPGEMVGSIAAQSIGEPATQLTLNTFHLAGVSSKSTVTRGVPRLKELINASKCPKTPSITAYLKNSYKDNKEDCKSILKKLQHITFNSFVEQVNIYYDPLIYEKDSLVDSDRLFIKYYYNKIIDTSDLNFEEYSPWLLRIKILKQELLNKKINMFEIYLKLSEYFKNNNNNISCIHTDDNSENLVFHIRFIYNSKDSNTDDRNKLYNLFNNLMNNFSIRGIKNISKIYMRTIKNDLNDKEEIVLDTKGTNLLKMLQNKYIDCKKTISNDIHEIFNIFGIEATRRILYEEIKSVIEHSGIYIDSRHLNLLVDKMTSKGHVMSIDRHGINKSDSGPLARSSFEETTDQLVKAGIFNEIDLMNSVTSNIITAQKSKFGTNLPQLIFDNENFYKNI